MRLSLYALHINTQSVHQDGVSFGVLGVEGLEKVASSARAVVGATCPGCQVYQANRHNSARLQSVSIHQLVTAILRSNLQVRH